SVPASAASGEYTLGIFGNANEDDTIDLKDVEYTERIILGLDDQTQLTDAKYDDKVDILDVTQIELIMLGGEKELTIMDSADRTVTIKKPIERIVICSCGEQGEALRILGAMDKVVGVSSKIQKEPAKSFFPEFQELPNVGDWDNYEAILSLNPDVVIMYDWTEWLYPDTEEHLPGVTLLRFNFYQSFQMFDEMRKLGYILDRNEEAQEYEDFIDGYLSIVEEKVETLSEDEKPRVYVETTEPWRTSNKEGAPASPIRMAGGRNIAEDEEGTPTGIIPEIDPEWVIEQNPEIIIKLGLGGFFDGYGEYDMSRLKEARGEVMNRAVLTNVDAVQNEKVYAICTGALYLPYFHVSVAYLAKWFHPDLFKDLDPQAIHQEYLEKYHGDTKDFVFIYPSLED
ncbi:MAG TPA: hypothetical protein C5S50_00490, partial [Methanosarcinaceae archaeon]|nr:hypothetical protein [Methanosarcinaceae archaeon]